MIRGFLSALFLLAATVAATAQTVERIKVLDFGIYTREVVGADGPQVISNEVFRPDADRRARLVAGALRTETLDDLIDAGFDPGLLPQPEGWWTR